MKAFPVVLRGSVVELEPYAPEHFDELCEAALAHPEIFRFMPGRLSTREDLAALYRGVPAMAQGGSGVFFVTRLRATGELVGSTACVVTDATHRRIEIGYTWLVPSAQRTRANTEAKYLQLRYAFETLGAMRVELKTDARNERSRRAILRIGAVEEGTLRAHMLCWDGHRRDSVYFSVVDTEWPAVKTRLEGRLSAGEPAALPPGDATRALSGAAP